MISIVIRSFVFVLYSISIVRVHSQVCLTMSQYDRCSLNPACGCLHMVGTADVGICVFKYVTCSELVPCESSSNLCHDPEYTCVHHPRCHNLPVCYPIRMMDQGICPPIPMTKTTTKTTTAILTTTTPIMTTTPVTITTTKTTTQQLVIPSIPVNASWAQNEVTVAGGYGWGSDTNQFFWPEGLFVDDDQTTIIADWGNHRIIQWKMGDTSGQVVAGGNGHGNRLDQLN
ncbi:unnamed protein product, partial [Rotaria sordida]